MCGYICSTREVLRSNGVKNLLDKQDHRGKDGYGAIALYENGTSKHIKYMDVTPLVNWIDALKGNPYIFVHHRATSVGGTKLKLAHPLEEGESILMQNGTNRDPYMMVSNAESDSEALVMLSDIMEPEDLERYILKNVGVVIFRKEGTFYIHRDDTRPLHVHTSGLMCSEPIVEGKWRTIDEGMFPVVFKEGKLVGLDIFGDVDVTDVGNVSVCSFCKKRHYVPEGFTVCHSCVAEGIPQKKDYVRHDVTYNNDYYDEYDDEYGWGFQRGGYQRSNNRNLPEKIDDTNSDGHKVVYEIIPSVHLKNPKYTKMHGVPVLFGTSMYLVPGTTSDDASTFLVKQVLFDSNKVLDFKSGNIPLNLEEGKVVNLMDLAVYWNQEEKAYDLQKNTYYLEGSLLGDVDKDLLLYDNFMQGYIIPEAYEYTPETYLAWC